jgi:hypothetical protein
MLAREGYRPSESAGFTLYVSSKDTVRGAMEKVNVAEKLALFNDYWNPRIVAELNGQLLKVVKLKGPFVWHEHVGEDEMFLVVKGSLRMEFRDRAVESAKGSSSWSRGAWSTDPSPRRKSRCCCSSPPAPSTPATFGTSARWPSPSTSEVSVTTPATSTPPCGRDP